MDKRRWLIAIIMSAILILTYIWIQGMFDDGDLRKAVTLVRSFQGGEIEREIERRHAGKLAGPPVWEAELRSGFWGHVRVQCTATLTDGSLVIYQFDTNLSNMAIHPGNDAGQSILAILAGPAGTVAAPSGGP